MGSRLLLDTCTLLWTMLEPHKISSKARQAIEGGKLLVSAVSGYEVALKYNLGKLRLSVRLEELFTTIKSRPDLHILPVSLEHAALAGSLPFTHKDLFDRMIIAQAKLEGVKVVTPDAVYGEYGVGVVW